MILERNLADRSMLTAGGVPFVLGCVLEGKRALSVPGMARRISSSLRWVAR
jgi:hypothetical protein